MEEKLNVTGRYWNNNTKELGYYLLIYYNIFDIGISYIKTVTSVTNIHLSHTL